MSDHTIFIYFFFFDSGYSDLPTVGLHVQYGSLGETLLPTPPTP